MNTFDETRTLLIIEDSADHRDLFRLALAAAGHLVFATGDPTQAVEMAAAREPDLVLCDIGMPEMDGYQVLRALQEDPRTRRFPVVFLTARTELAERVRAFRFGVVDFISKPVDPAALAARVDAILTHLAQRAGRAEATGDGVEAFIEEVQRDGRTGLLVLGESGSAPETRIVVRNGELLSERPPEAPGFARFDELDALHEDLVAHETARLSPAGPLPDFGHIPEPLREVIVADDNDDFRASLAAVLVQRGFQVREARDGADLLKQVFVRLPWLIVLDVRMPVMDGFAACRRLRAHEVTRHIPVVFLSGWDDLGERAAAIDAGADEFLSKRTSIRELLLRIQILMRRYVAGEKQRGAILEGRIDMVGAPAALQMCHALGLTGTLEAIGENGRIFVGFVEGALKSATSPGAGGREAVFDFLCTQRGRFSFTAGPAEAGEAVDDAVGALILEGCRRIDEHLPRARPGAGGAPPRIEES
jgi:DNA-binding response OmpR family regulator